MASAPETRVLSQALEQAIGESRVRVAVFVAFEFDPTFFEHSILPLVFRRAFSNNEAVRRAQLEEELQEINHVAVYYDRSGLKTAGGGARLDYQRIGISISGRVLHAKHVFLLLDDPAQRLAVLTTSANLTQSGWWTNVEVGHVHEIRAGQKDSVRQDLLGRDGLITRLRRLDKTTQAADARPSRDDPHAGLEAILRFLDTQIASRGWSRQDDRWFPRLWHGEEPFPAFLARYAATRCRLEIIVPFFDGKADAPTLRALIDELCPTSTRVLLPRNDDGSARCAEPFYEAVRALPNVSWGQLPRTYTAYGKAGKETSHRYVHAKIYRIFAPDRGIEILCVGSPNLTSAAHKGARRGNLESAMLLDHSHAGGSRPGWWLERLEDTPGLAFRDGLAEDEPVVVVLPVTLRFDWDTGILSYFWETRDVPERVEIATGPRVLAAVAPVQAGEWIGLAATLGPTFRDVLRAGALLDVRVGEHIQRVLVQEVGMEHRPSLVHDLTPEQILEYWSLLTSEQRDAFLEHNVLRVVDSIDEAVSNVEPVDEISIFDRFAGIFHAFSCLQDSLEQALDRGDASGDRFAVYRLFGERHDSLRSLVEKLVGDQTRDRVNRYFGLLCACALVRRIQSTQPQFGQIHRRSLRDLAARINLASVRAEFTFGDAEERDRFFAWLEEMFFKPVRAREVRA
jgi:hypothetical protein